MLPLIDSDILLYEIGFSGQIVGEEGEIIPLDFDRVAEMLDEKIRIICDEVRATEPPILFITGKKDFWNNKRINPNHYKEKFIPNFRDAIAVTKPYKGTRKPDKPFHFNNLIAYITGKYTYMITNGIEADDMMSIIQTTNTELFREDKDATIICSRDKDLRMVEGWHYSWECGKQAAKGPLKTDELGWIDLVVKELPSGISRKIEGYGLKFFYSQMLTGDVVDNIPGLPRCGPVKAYDILKDCEDVEECFQAAWNAYCSKLLDAKSETYQEDFFKLGDYWNEQHALLWMLKEWPDGG